MLAPGRPSLGHAEGLRALLSTLSTLSISLSVTAALLVATPAGAQERLTLNGSWTASALRETWAIGDWGDACGPRPRPQGAGGGAVQVREQGNELTISGAGRTFSTAECWEQMPGLARTSHSASGDMRSWRTRCSTPANDPRRATIVTTISATDTSISLHETGQYQFVIQDTNCTAAVTRTRSFGLARRDGEEPAAAPSASASATAAPVASAAPTPPPPPAPVEPRPAAKPCAASGGEPARLEVRPSRKLLRPGDRFSFRAVVLDGEGCPVATRPTWSVAPGPLAAKVSIGPDGALSVAEDAGEGQVELTASVAGKGATVSVEITAAERYAALLASAGFNERGETEESSVAVIAAGSIGGRTTLAEDTARSRKQVFIAIVAALAAALALVGLVLMRRGTRRVCGEEADHAPPGDVEPPFPSEPLADSPSGADSPEAVVRSAPTDEAAGAAGGAAMAKPARAKRGKICPTCGERYPGEATFCGKDGTSLVLINERSAT